MQQEKKKGAPEPGTTATVGHEVHGMASELGWRIHNQATALQTEANGLPRGNPRRVQLEARVQAYQADLQQLAHVQATEAGMAIVRNMATRMGIAVDTLSSTDRSLDLTAKNGLTVGRTQTDTRQLTVAPLPNHRASSRTQVSGVSANVNVGSGSVTTSTGDTRYNGVTGTSQQVTTGKTTSLDLGKTPNAGVATTRTQTDTASDGSSVKRADNDSVNVGFDPTKKQASATLWAGDSKTVTAPDKTSTTTGSDVTAAYTVSRDAATAKRTVTDSTSTSDADGNATSKTATSGSVTKGVMLGGKEGYGVSRGIAASSGTQTTTGAKAVSGGADVAVTDQGVAAKGNGAGSLSGKHARIDGSIGGGVSFKTTIDEVAKGPPPKYVSVTTVEMSINASVGGGTSNRLRPGAKGALDVSVGVSGGASETLVFKRPLEGSEVASYSAALEAAKAGKGVAESKYADLQAMRSALAMKAASAKEMVASHVVSDPSVGKSLGAGASLELTDVVTKGQSASAQGSYGVFAAGANGSLTQGTTRGIKVEGMTDAKGVAFERITLTFKDDSSKSVGGNASLDGMGGQIQSDASASKGGVYSIDLPRAVPNHDADYKRFTAAKSKEEASAISTELKGSGSEKNGHSSGTAIGMGAMNGAKMVAGISASDVRSGDETITVATGADGQRTLSGQHNSSSASGMALVGNGTALVSVNNVTSASSTVDANAPVGHQQEIIVSARETGGVQLPDWMQKIWRTTYDQLDTYELSEQDIEALVGRARNESFWSRQAPYSVVKESGGWRTWESFRRGLVSPRPPAEWTQVNAAQALRLARGKAVTDFVEGVSARAGIAGIREILRGGGAEALGAHMEWPDSLRAQSAIYTYFKGKLREARASFPGLGEDERRTKALEITNGFNTLVAQVTATADSEFADPSSKVEMIAEMQRLIREVHDLAAGARASVGDAQAQATAGAAAEAAGLPASERARKQAEADQAAGLIEECVKEEQHHFEAAGAGIYQHFSGTRYDGTRDILSSSEASEAMSHLDAISSLVGRWRAAYGRYGMLARELEFSRDRIRFQQKAPNIDWRVTLRRALTDACPDMIRGVVESVTADRVKAWERERF